MRGNFSFAKRKKEMERKDKQKKKAERKAQRANRSHDPNAPDPDLEGQVAGPQPGQILETDGEEGTAEIEAGAEEQESEADAPETESEPTASQEKR